MNSKERLRAAASFKSVDRAPAGFEATASVVEKLKRHYRFQDIENIYKRFEIDLRYLSPPYIGPELKTSRSVNGNLVAQSFWGFKEEEYRVGDEVFHQTCFYPLDGVSTIKEVEDFHWPNADWFDYKAMARECQRFPHKAIVAGHEGPFQIVTCLIRMEEFFVLMVKEPQVAKRILDKMVEFELEYYQRMLEACEGQIDVLRLHDDYGTQISTLFSVEMWCDFFKDNTRRLADIAHQYNAFYQQHSCGAISPLIPELIKCGVDIIEPIQKLTGLEPETLLKRYGGKIAFHGGIDTQGILPYGTPEEVKTETCHYLKTLNLPGGYILMASQSFESDVPIENIEAVYSADRI